MKKHIPIVLSLILSICLLQTPLSAKGNEKVLLIVKEIHGSSELQSLKNNEVIVMKDTLEKAGFKVEVASASGRTFLFKEVTLESDVKLAEVNIGEYAGFIFNCSALGANVAPGSEAVPAFGEAFSKPEEVAIAKKIIAAGKPVAAQDKGVVILAQAGGLAGKKYSYGRDLLISEAIYEGQSVIQDGNIITSTYCPYLGSNDQTVELTNALIAVLQK